MFYRKYCMSDVVILSRSPVTPETNEFHLVNVYRDCLDLNFDYF